MSKRKRSSHSHRPLTRQEVTAICTRLMRGDVHTGEERGLVKRLADAPAIAVPFLLEQLRHGTPAEQDVASYLLPMVGGRAVKESLLEITRDAGATDRARAMAMATLDQLGEKVNYESLFNQLRDPEKFPQQVMDEMLTTASTDESALEAFVWDIERMPAAKRLEMIRSFGHLGDPRMLRLLLPLLYARENRTIMAAIDALETLEAPEAVAALTELSQASSESQVRSRARAVYGKLALAAIGPESQGRKQWRLPPQELPLFKAMVCTIDGDGAQSIIVSRRRPDGRFKAVCILFNDHQGIKDCFGQDMLTKGEGDSIIRSMEREGMSWVDVGLSQCRRLVAEARAINRRVRRKLPVGLEIWGTLLQDGPEAARLWRDDEQEMSISNERRTEPDLLRRSDELLKLPEFRSWGFDPRDIEPSALMAFEAIRRSNANMPKKASSLDLLVADTLKGLAKPGWRRLVESRLRRQAWLLNKLGRTEHCRLALAAATALGKESHIPLDTQPFLRGMLLKSLFEMSSALKDYAESLPGLVGDRLVAEEGGRRNKSATGLYKIKVSLQGMRSIWRVIEIKGNQTLHTLHKAIFSAFDRFDEHLYAFYLSNKAYDEASEYESPYSDERTGRDASRASIDSLGLHQRQKFLYIFDFGDNWQHTIEVLEIREEVPKGKYPRLIEKKGDSPPQYPDAEEDENS